MHGGSVLNRAITLLEHHIGSIIKFQHHLAEKNDIKIHAVRRVHTREGKRPRSMVQLPKVPETTGPDRRTLPQDCEDQSKTLDGDDCCRNIR